MSSTSRSGRNANRGAVFNRDSPFRSSTFGRSANPVAEGVGDSDSSSRAGASGSGPLVQEAHAVFQNLYARLREMGAGSIVLEGSIDGLQLWVGDESAEAAASAKLATTGLMDRVRIEQEHSDHRPVDESLQAELRNDVDTMNDWIRQELNERSFDIVNNRYCLEGGQRRTLQSLAEKYDVTRERIRQLERSAITALRRAQSRDNPLGKFITRNARQIHRQMGGALLTSPYWVDRWRRSPSGTYRLAVEVVYDRNVYRWLDETRSRLEVSGTFFGWTEQGLSDEDKAEVVAVATKNATNRGGLSGNVNALLLKHGLPMSFASLYTELGDVPRDELHVYLEGELGATIVDGEIIAVRNLSTMARLLSVLKEVGHPAKTFELCARYNELYSDWLSDHTALASLNRATDVVLVGRGTYDLRSRVNLSDDDISVLMERVEDYLDRVGEFCSAKVIWREIRQSLERSLALRANEYILYWFCRERSATFKVTRGWMVGLNRVGFEERFSSLEATVLRIVREHGPISIAGIQERMAHQREVFDSAVKHILLKSPDIDAIDTRERSSSEIRRRTEVLWQFST